MRCVLDCMKIVCRLLVAMAILTVGLVQVSLAAESKDLRSVTRSALLTRCLNLCYAVNESSNA